MSRRLASLGIVGVVVGLLLLPGMAVAQGRAEGTITGQVTDETKAVLPGVTVTATNPQTGFTREAITDAEGAFRAPAAAAGAPTRSSPSLAGFGTFRQNVTVAVGAEQQLPISLTVATLQETITVTGEAPLVETTKTEQGTQFNSNEMTEPADEQPQLPGARAADARRRRQRRAASRASGNRNTQNNFNVDGMTNKNLNGGGDFGRVSPEGIQEFQIVTQSYPAEYGGAAGGVTNAVSKSGTNAVHAATASGTSGTTRSTSRRSTRRPSTPTAREVEAFPVEAANFAAACDRGLHPRRADRARQGVLLRRAGHDRSNVEAPPDGEARHARRRP